MSAFSVPLRREFPDRTLCNRREAFADPATPRECRHGCSANQIAAQEMLAKKLLGFPVERANLFGCDICDVPRDEHEATDHPFGGLALRPQTPLEGHRKP